LCPLSRTSFFITNANPACSCVYICKFQFHPIHPPSRRLSGAMTDRAQRQGTRALRGGPGAQGASARSGIPRSEPCDQDRTGDIRPGEGERLRVAPLLLATVKSPELGQARARVVPGSPGWVREGENDTAKSVAGLWPRIRGQRGGMAGKRPRTGRRNSGEGFRPWGEGLRRAKA
jgi:hypothetical protein